VLSSGVILIALAALSAAAFWVTGSGALAGEPWAPAFLYGYAAAWVFYAIAGVTVNRSRRFPRWVLLWIVLVAVGLRVVALQRTPPLSTDVWRYLWDGRVANVGINPFLHPPDAPEVRHLRDQNWPRINFRHIRTIYPPAAQMLFAGLARVRDSDAEAFRWASTLFDLGSVLLLVVLLRRTRRPPERVIWYAWCPLVVTEVTAGAHIDPFGLFLLLAAFLLTSRRDGPPGLASGAALAGAMSAKGYALLVVPFFVRRGGWRLALPLVAVSAILLLPYLGAGRLLFSGLTDYLKAWKTNSSVFLLLDGQLMKVTEAHFEIARAVTVLAVVAVIARLAWRPHRSLEWLLGCSFAAFGAQLFIGAPTLPWYVIWLVPALCWWTIPGVVLFTLTVSAQYYARWIYEEPLHETLLWAGYLPVYALLLAQLIWTRLRRHRSGASHSP
jgi:hypothetical protein